jgi:Tol biopolymer transport system component
MNQVNSSSLSITALNSCRVFTLLLFVTLHVSSAFAQTAPELISVAHPGTVTGRKGAFSPVISADGGRVAFLSQSDNLVPNDTNGTGDVFVRDLPTNTTILVSVNRAGTASGNLTSTDVGSSIPPAPVISADGRYVAFTSRASDLVANDGNNRYDVFVRDLQSGTTSLVSVNAAGTNSGNSGSYGPVITPDGRYVVFESSAGDIVANDGNSYTDIFIRDMQAGITKHVSINIHGTSTNFKSAYTPTVSADGRRIAFHSEAPDLVPGDTNSKLDVFVRDMVAEVTTLVSVNRTGAGSGNNSSVTGVISADGHHVAFYSFGSDLVPGDTNNTSDVFVRNLEAGTTALISINNAGTASGNQSSYTYLSSPKINEDGRFVVFQSLSTDLVSTSDTNNAQDIFVRDVQGGTTSLVTINSSGTKSGNGRSGTIDPTYVLDPSITADGHYVLFGSYASDLVGNDFNNASDVFVRDLQASATTLVSLNYDGTASSNSNSLTRR